MVVMLCQTKIIPVAADKLALLLVIVLLVHIGSKYACMSKNEG